MSSFTSKINDLNYGTIERAITEFFDMGYVNSSGLPIVFPEDTSGDYFITATKKQGHFRISISRLKDNSLELRVSTVDLKTKK